MRDLPPHRRRFVGNQGSDTTGASAPRIGYVARPGDPGEPELAERTDPVWDRLSAVREGRVYVDASDGLYCCGLRHVQYALELYAANAFPEAGCPQPAPYEAYDPQELANAPATTPTA